MRSLFGRVLTVVWAAILAVLIAMIGQGVWTALIVTNIRTSPAIPWAVVVMAPLIWLMWQYLSGKWWPRNTSEARRRHLRANVVSGPVFAWALVAGGFSIGALAGCWIVMSQLVRMPANVLPDMSMYPWPTAALLVMMGSLLGPLLEQAGFWGYCQSILERKFPGLVAIAISSVLFAQHGGFYSSGLHDAHDLTPKRLVHGDTTEGDASRFSFIRGGGRALRTLERK